MIKKRGTSWWVVVYAGRDPLTGRKRQKTGTARTYAEARQLEARLITEVAGGKHKGAATKTVADLVAAWLDWGMGPISAAQVLVSWSHAGRLRSQAAFAALGGASPIPASSGQVTRHRLNRGEDRRLNRALHTVALVRLRDDPVTRADAARRRAEGKSSREIRWCIKRAVARNLFTLLQQLDRADVEVVRVC
jgi:transposase